MTPRPAALWARLAAAGLVEGEQPVPEAGRRWYVRLMLGAAAWLAAITLMGFIVSLTFVLLKSREGLLGTGMVACALAYAMFQRGRTSHWHAQLGLAASFVGQGLMAWALFGSFDNGEALPGTTASLWMALIEALLTVALPNSINRFVSAQFAVGLLALAADTQGLGTLVLGGAAVLTAVVWLNEFRWSESAEALRAIGFGVASSLPGLAMMVRLNTPPPAAPGDLGISLNGLDFRAPWLASVLVGAVLLAAVLTLCRRQGLAAGARAMGLAGLAAVLCGMLDLKAAGIASSLLLVVLGFAHGNRLLLALGLLSLGACVSWFYYALSLTLLEKSLWLAVAGGVLLLARTGLRVLLGPPPPEVDTHA